MSLSLLPPELKLGIAEYLDPTACFNFAIACRSYWRLCQPVIRAHTRFFAEYQVFDNADYSGPNAWQKLIQVLDNPRTGWYVREASFPYGRHYRDAQVHRVPDGDVETILHAAAQVNSLYSSQEMKDGDFLPLDTIYSGSQTLHAILLMHRFPFLEKLRLTETGSDFFTLVRTVARAYSSMPKHTCFPFQHLTTVAVSFPGQDGDFEPDMCRNFMRIPSLRKFAVLMMGSYYEEPEADGFFDAKEETRDSNTKELVFASCQFTVRTLKGLLWEVKSLERFSYGGRLGITSYVPYTPKEVIATLLQYAGPSLEQLTLEHNDIELELHSYGGTLEEASLIGFGKLRTLKCNWKMLYPEVEESIDGSLRRKVAFGPEYDVRNLLPKSLESLHLEGVFTDKEWEQITTTFKRPNDHVPNLSNVYLERKHGINEGNTVFAVEGSERRHQIPNIGENPLSKLLHGDGPP